MRIRQHFFPKVWKVENFIEAASRGSISFWQMFLNTMKIALPSTIFNIIFSSLAGYAFARLKFPFRDTIFMCFIAAMMVPFAITLIPRFLMFKDFGFYDTYVPLIVPVMFGTPFSIFLTRQFFMTLPKELEEAAIMDGCIISESGHRFSCHFANQLLRRCQYSSFRAHTMTSWDQLFILLQMRNLRYRWDYLHSEIHLHQDMT